jgi:hypothetical protein
VGHEESDVIACMRCHSIDQEVSRRRVYAAFDFVEHTSGGSGVASDAADICFDRGQSYEHATFSIENLLRRLFLEPSAVA